MANHNILDNKNHKDIKIITDFDDKFSEKTNSALIFPTEIKDAQRDYPILFIKNPDTGEFQSVVLLGLVENENLYINKGWQASYIPAMISKGPFVIAFEEKDNNGEKIKQPIVAIDMDNPRVNTKSGEALFLENSTASPYLQQVNQSLKTLYDGSLLNQEMFKAFLKHDLIEPIALNIELNNGSKINLAGNYTINEEKLSKLTGDALNELHSAGLLRIAYFITASLGNIKRLVDLKNAQDLTR
ncbi:SapC family protein [Colwellia sp. E2M01]|uniref:SapC family protein n=1 Tax=Colwellia sp. E2M01 TaxID=2841561 RepID=UPI001C0A5625|nr:SapC family protein [Colwellia sp. E2M01]MBU2871132.1 SapC family protein [Colwellia sp. E2M01]